MILRNKQIRWFKATDYVKTNGSKAYDRLLELVPEFPNADKDKYPAFFTYNLITDRNTKDWDHWNPRISEVFAQGRTMKRPITAYLSKIPKVFK